MPPGLQHHQANARVRAYPPTAGSTWSRHPAPGWTTWSSRPRQRGYITQVARQQQLTSHIDHLSIGKMACPPSSSTVLQSHVEELCQQELHLQRHPFPPPPPLQSSSSLIHNHLVYLLQRELHLLRHPYPTPTGLTSRPACQPHTRPLQQGSTAHYQPPRKQQTSCPSRPPPSFLPGHHMGRGRQPQQPPTPSGAPTTTLHWTQTQGPPSPIPHLAPKTGHAPPIPSPGYLAATFPGPIYYGPTYRGPCRGPKPPLSGPKSARSWAAPCLPARA